MDTKLFVIISLVSFIAIIIGFLLANHYKIASKSSIVKDIKSGIDDLLPLDNPTVPGDIVVFDCNGKEVMSCHEIDSLPQNKTLKNIDHSFAINGVRQFATDIISRALTLPGKTVEIVFDPSIQQGLNSGIYEVVKVKATSGIGDRSIARDLYTKKFVGHGRCLDAGKLRNLGIGMFHILSIAVAQAHLAEINMNLEEIKKSVRDIRDFLEDKDVSQLQGTINYLEYIVNFIHRMDKQDDFPTDKRAELESIRRELMVWFAQLERESDRIRESIEKQGDEDSWGGTKNTSNKLEEFIKPLGQLIQKFKLINRTSILFNITSAYLEPISYGKSSYTKIDPPDVLIDVIFQLENKSKFLLDCAIWNTSNTLKKRQNRILNETSLLDRLAKEEMSLFEDSMDKLESQLGRFVDSQNKIRMAIAFDSEGNPDNVAIM